MKLKRCLKLFSCFVIFNMFMYGVCIGADVETFKIKVEGNPIATVQYDGYDLTAKKIKVEGSDNIAYCLEINEKYPSGETFIKDGSASKAVENIMAAGHPNRNFKELKLDNENEAYFATQIAIWSSLEGYDVNKIKGNNSKIIDAIKNIYNDGLEGKYTNKIRTKVYKTNNEAIQDVVVIYMDDLVTEDKIESVQSEYAPQEG